VQQAATAATPPAIGAAAPPSRFLVEGPLVLVIG
jgi:hypothetical protein